MVSDNHPHDPPASPQETAAAEALSRELADNPGIVSTELDAEHGRVIIGYDPKVMTDSQAASVAERLGTAAREHFEKCTLRLAGRACEACALKLERKAASIAGVRRATATFIGGIMSITYDSTVIAPEQVVEQVRALGAPVRPSVPPFAAEGAAPPQRATLGDHLREIAVSNRLEMALTAVTFVSMVAAHAAHHLNAPGWSTALYTVAYLSGGYFGVLAGYQSLRQLTIDVDLLMVLAALGAAYIGHPFEGAMLLFLFSLSNVLQTYAIDRARHAIHSLMKLRPETALVRRNGETRLLPIGELVVGDTVIVRPGERVPLDGTVIEGTSYLDESSVTGESMPVAKEPGSPLFAGTINQSGGIEMRVTKLAQDSMIAKLIRMVEEAQSEKARTQRFLDRAEQWYAVGVLLLTALLIFVPPAFLGHSFKESFYRAITVMVVASPCALIISTPASILSAIGGAARRGILFKGGAHLEKTGLVKVVAFDKTGTLTEGRPCVTDVIPFDDDPALAGAMAPGAVLLQMAAAVEAKSEHPLAEAIVSEARRLGLPIAEVSGFQSVTGKSARAMLNGVEVSVGSLRSFEAIGSQGLERAREQASPLYDAGKTVVLVACGPGGGAPPRIVGLIAVADTPRPDAAAAVRQLKAAGIERVVMLTGDNKRVAAAIAARIGVDDVHADLLPEDKVRVVRELARYGPVAMVGDGVNDAPALATATVGIAMGAAGTDVAMETADVVLMANDISKVPYAIALSRRARIVVYQNLAVAGAVILLLIIGALGFDLPLPAGVIGHEGSTVLVCLNGLRLLLFQPRLPA
ncbi:MAG: heavy metal translocating P-type ATPase [Candidatus Sumerlaeaceae bacterium]|nr:heavy metal translocating P-type ATPase [Candidatus Sumerlaeaceae bacterium]